LKDHFHDIDEKHLDKQQEYKDAEAEKEEESHEEAEEEDDDSGHSQAQTKKDDDVETDDDFLYKSSVDYERIKALSEAQVERLHKNPGNCEHHEKDGMVCAVCKDPDTGDTSEVKFI
jgi:phage-related tail protein